MASADSHGLKLQPIASSYRRSAAASSPCLARSVARATRLNGTIEGLTGGPASLQERFVGRRGSIEVPPGLGDAGEGVQRRDDQQDLALGVEAFEARTGGWLGVLQPPQRHQVPGDDQVVHGEEPAVASRFQQIVGLAQELE